MARNVNAKTLFHLVPLNGAARDNVLHPVNKGFVSPSANTKLGLEIGFHVPSIPGGHVITRLGRRADLILREKDVSAVHVAFEIHPETLVVLLSVRSKHPDSVQVAPAVEGQAPAPAPTEVICGDCVIFYGQDYTVKIASNHFSLVWRKIKFLKDLALQGYHESLKQLQDVESRDHPTEFGDSKLHSWYHTRLHTKKGPIVQDIKERRVLIGEGAFGKVFKTVHRVSGHNIAVKQVNLKAHGDIERQRVTLHREIKALERLSHGNIIDYLGATNWDSDAPEIFMSLREGNLASLAQSNDKFCTSESLINQVLEQMQSALDCLAFNDICHRDVKPENILYSRLKDYKHRFQLADFGLVNYSSLATTFCGTAYYQAPELYPKYGEFRQSSKMDVWSLFITIIFTDPRFDFPPPAAKGYDGILQAVEAAVVQIPELKHMARMNPEHRASAAQLLVAQYNGRGLTTPRAKVPPISPGEELLPLVETSPWRPANRQQPKMSAMHLIKYPPPTHRHPRLAHHRGAGPSNFPYRKPSPHRGRSPGQQEQPPQQPSRAHRGGFALRRGASANPERREQRKRESSVPRMFTW